MKNKSLLVLLCVIAMGLFSSCEEEAFVPKPKGYNKIDLPAHAYQQLKEDHPYTFEYSKYAEIRPDKSKLAEPHWIDVYYPEQQCFVQITYKDIKNNKQHFNEHIDDSHKLAIKHNVKAYSIDESINRTPKGYTATYFELEGEVPSQFQFYVTDSTEHFLRGALYFKTATRNDSLAPVIRYMKKDILHLINTLEFK
ncbi:MAG: gliding motility lipoprotein GldD [Chitinophagaceae bacterium]|nr:gliding motility lipoprotein GldD [Chitinophagaceae bacterium]